MLDSLKILWKKYKDNAQLDGVTFHACATIDEVFEIVFDK